MSEGKPHFRLVSGLWRCWLNGADEHRPMKALMDEVWGWLKPRTAKADAYREPQVF